MRRRLFPIVLAALAVISRDLCAQLTQSPEYDINGLRAILLTPAAALPQVVPIPNGSRLGHGLAVKFGRYSFSTATYSNVAISGWLALASRVQVGGTFGQRSCEGCEGANMGSVDVHAMLFHRPGRRTSDADTDIGLEASAGMGKAKVSDFTARAVFVGLPVGVTLPQSNDSQFSLFVSPGFAYGRLAEGDSTIGALPRVIIGAGAAMHFPAGLGAHVSAHRVITGDSPTQLGVALSWNFGRTRNEETR